MARRTQKRRLCWNVNTSWIITAVRCLNALIRWHSPQHSREYNCSKGLLGSDSVFRLLNFCSKFIESRLVVKSSPGSATFFFCISVCFFFSFMGRSLHRWKLVTYSVLNECSSAERIMLVNWIFSSVFLANTLRRNSNVSTVGKNVGIRENGSLKG